MLAQLWFGEGSAARAARGVLLPLSGLYRAGAAVRNFLYDRGFLSQHRLAIPAVSVGNISVGGTGKTPVAAWLAGELARRGVRPGIVLRGYGDDEPAVHRRLNPHAVVVVDPDRVAGVAAAARAGAEVAVLDDAFQHRRALRDADIVLVSADRWPAHVHSLPAGPFREPLASLERASLAIVTRKAADVAAAGEVRRAIAARVPGCPVAVMHLAPAALVDVASGLERPLAALAGRPVLAIGAVGDPRAFARQLAAAGARVTLRAFPDHHPYSDAEITELAAAGRDVERSGGLVVCTLKDAVKLSPRWPSGEPALSFLSQQVILEAGRDSLERLLDSVIRAHKPDAAAPG